MKLVHFDRLAPDQEGKHPIVRDDQTQETAVSQTYLFSLYFHRFAHFAIALHLQVILVKISELNFNFTFQFIFPPLFPFKSEIKFQ